MKRMQKGTGRASSIPGGLAVSCVISLGLTLAGSLLLSGLVLRGTMAMENIGYGVLILLVTASFLGGITAAARIKHRILMVCLLSGGVYFAVLLAITALFFGGQYQGVGVTGLLILGGSGGAGLLLAGKGTGAGKYRKRHG